MCSGRWPCAVNSLSVCLSLSLSVSVCLSLSLSVSLCVYLSLSLSVCLSICLSVGRSVSLPPLSHYFSLSPPTLSLSESIETFFHRLISHPSNNNHLPHHDCTVIKWRVYINTSVRQANRRGACPPACPQIHAHSEGLTTCRNWIDFNTPLHGLFKQSHCRTVFFHLLFLLLTLALLVMLFSSSILLLLLSQVVVVVIVVVVLLLLLFALIYPYWLTRCKTPNYLRLLLLLAFLFLSFFLLMLLLKICLN